MTIHPPYMSQFAQDPRVLRLGRAIVETDQTDAMLDMLGRALRFANTGHQGGLHLLTGPTNTGKTSGIRTFMMQLATDIGGVVELASPPPNGLKSPVASVEYVSVAHGEQIHRPLVHIEVGRHPTFNSLMRDVLHALMRGRPPHFRNYPEMMTLLYNQLYGQEIRLIVFDDVQHIALSRYGTDAAEVIKLLAKITNAEIVLAGLETGTVKVATENDQVKLLRLEHLKIGPMPFPTSADDPFVGLLWSLEPYMPFEQRSPLAEIDLAQRLHQQTRGVIGALKTLLRMATVYALENQLPSLDQKVLAEALTTRMPHEANFMIGANVPPAPSHREVA